MVISTTSSRAFSYLLFSATTTTTTTASSNLLRLRLRLRLPSLRPFSSASPYPLYYELVRHRPPSSPPRRLPPPPASLATEPPADDAADPPMDRSKRKYYRKRQQRMYGASDSDSDAARGGADGYVELQPEIVDFPRLHAREQELYFHDAFAFPWEKDKHYRMVYQLEKKYFPDQCLDKAFVDATPAPAAVKAEEEKSKKRGKKSKREEGKKDGGEEERDERSLVFFEDDKDRPAANRGVSEKKVEEFFKCLKKVPNASGRRGGSQVPEDEGVPHLATRRTQLPPRWDGPFGTVVLVDKPKGWTSFTVCGKLRRLVKVQKVGHAGTLDPMATGLLIVCVGKATKLVDSAKIYVLPSANYGGFGLSDNGIGAYPPAFLYAMLWIPSTASRETVNRPRQRFLLRSLLCHCSRSGPPTRPS